MFTKERHWSVSLLVPFCFDFWITSLSVLMAEANQLLSQAFCAKINNRNLTAYDQYGGIDRQIKGEDLFETSKVGRIILLYSFSPVGITQPE